MQEWDFPRPSFLETGVIVSKWVNCNKNGEKSLLPEDGESLEFLT